VERLEQSYENSVVREVDVDEWVKGKAEEPSEDEVLTNILGKGREEE